MLLGIFPAGALFSLFFIVYVLAGNIQSGTRFLESCAHTVLVTVLYLIFVVPDLAKLALPGWAPWLAVSCSSVGVGVVAALTVVSRYLNERDHRTVWIARDMHALT